MVSERHAQLAELTFNRARFEEAATETQRTVERWLEARRSVGCRDRDGKPLKKPFPFMLCEAGSFKTEVFGRWLRMFNEMHEDHRKRCVRCGTDARGLPLHVQLTR